MNAIQLRLASLCITGAAILLSRFGLGHVLALRRLLWGTVLFVNFLLWLAPYVERWWRRRHHHLLEANRLIEQGRVAAAQPHLEKAWQVIKRQRTSTTAQKLDVLLNLAEAQRLNRQVAAAFQTITLAEGLASASPRLHELRARVQADCSELDAAAQSWREAILLEQIAERPDPVRLAHQWRELGLVQRRGGHAAEATESLRVALDLLEHSVGASHPDVALTLGLLGTGFQKEGNVSEALLCLRRAVSLREASHPVNNGELARQLYHLALAREQAGDLENAVKTYERLLSVREQLVGGDPDELAHVYYNVANLYYLSGQLARAEEAARRCVTILQGKDNQRVADALYLLGMLFERAGRDNEAALNYAQALLIRDRVLGSGHEKTVETVHRYANLLRAARRDREADALMTRLPDYHAQNS